MSSDSGRSALFCLNMMVEGLCFVINGVNQEPSHVRRNCVICIMNYEGRLTGTVVRNYSKNNGLDLSAVQGSVNNKLARVRVSGG